MSETSADIGELVGRAIEVAKAAYFAAEAKMPYRSPGVAEFGKPDKVSLTIYIEGGAITIELPIKRAVASTRK
ncbi:hypothetical protein FHX08_003423 [Rhizobium sp. BK529]|uniref:hypothetical protein n=1 Tax=unclassified Rhizobium TaxID=2613769 RepID=UPI001051E6C1|nr:MULTISPECIES: hypothetical protein [unclassified Rhizobium]MBB3593079.1 hypothetical protein [Rhizobium sp. BK529]TCS07460.1 hypothetical protein EV281_1021079 [Rhizobium sp. BK418]